MQVPHRSVTEKPSVALQKAALDLQKKNESYQLLSDSDGEEVYQIPTKVSVKSSLQARGRCTMLCYYTPGNVSVKPKPPEKRKG